MPLLKRSFNDIMQSAKAYLLKTGSNAVSVEGTPEHATASLIAREISGLYNSVEYMQDGMMLSTATAADLDRIAEKNGLTRGEAAAPYDDSKSNVKFYISPRFDGSAVDLAVSIGQDSITIPAGTEVSNGGSKVYYTTADVTFGEDIDPNGEGIDDSVFVDVRAYGQGSTPNVDAGELSAHNLSVHATLGAISHLIEITNLLPIANGSVLESDQDLRYRISQAFASQAKGNITSLLQAARSIPGVADAYLVDNIYGTGTVGLFIDSTTPIISPGIINAVQAAVDEVKSSGVRVHVLYPEYIGLNIKYETIYFDITAVTETNTAITKAIINYINNLNRGETLYMSKLNALVANHSNIKNAELKHIKSGSYDVLRQAIDNSITLLPVDQQIGLSEKWFTSSSLIELCKV